MKVELKTSGIARNTSGVISLTVRAEVNGKVIGTAFFFDDGEGLQSDNTWVHASFRRLGIATSMYMRARQVAGKKVVPGRVQTDEGRALWVGFAKKSA